MSDGGPEIENIICPHHDGGQIMESTRVGNQFVCPKCGRLANVLATWNGVDEATNREYSGTDTGTEPAENVDG